MTKNINFEEAEEMLYEKHGDKIKLLEFTRMHSHKSRFECKICGHTWYTEAQSTILKGRGCKKCASKNLKEILNTSLEYMIDYINNSDGCEFIKLLEEPHGKWTKMLIKLSCGHEKETSFQNFRSSIKLCKKCMMQETNKKRIRSIDQILQTLLENELELVGFPDGYNNSKSLISYRCKYGHVTTKTVGQFFCLKTCRECKAIKMSTIFMGDKGIHWNGGITSIKHYVVSNIKEWKKESMKNCNYKCVITGDKFDAIHHLYAFNLILKDSFEELNLPILENVGLYTEEELISLISLVKEKHNEMLGVCLKGDVHKLFHKLYGQGNNTPAQFTEFKQRIQSGEIQLPG